MKNNSLILRLLLTLISMSCFFANQVKAVSSILLKSGSIATSANFQDQINQSPLTGEIYNGYYYRMMQFEVLPTGQQKSSIELSGIHFLGYVPFNTYYVAIPINYNLQNLAVYQVRTLLPIPLNSKLSLVLREDAIPAYAKKGGDVKLIVQYYKNISFAAASSELINRGCTIEGNFEEAQLITISVAENNWKKIAALPYIKYVQVINDVPVPEDTKGRSLHRSNVINSDYSMGRHYDGSGVSIALADDGFVGPHIDFTGRITQFTSSTGQTHGDMTSGIAVGAGNLDPTIKGMASGAHIYIYDIGGYPQIVNAAQNLANYGTVITSTSYSQGCNTYDTYSQSGDQLMHQLKVVLPVFSAGNNNGANCGYGAGTQWGNITGGYKQGKNVLAAANLDAYEVIDNTSSHGPAEDGRIKSDISSNGKDQMSTDENNSYQVGGGTSAACPGMAGICAQLYQAYRELTGQPNPEAALIKACLLNSAEDIGNPGPDYFYGYGRVNALRAVKTLEDMHYMSDSILNGGTNLHSILVPPGTKRVRVMVLWNDVEGDPSAARALVNDLNCSLADPSATSFNPWVLNPAPNAATLANAAVRSIDSLNNMEQITIDNPNPGPYTLTVDGHSVPFGPQKYYVVYQFDQDDIVVTYPNGGEGFVPGETELLRWDAFTKTGNYLIEYSADSGSTWNTITSVGANVRQYDWVVPNTVSANAFIRVSNGNVSGISSSTFTIVGLPTNLNVNWACADSVKLSWTAVSGADAYEVSQLGTFYMDSVATSTTPFAIVHNTSLADTLWFSVKALKGTHGKGRRAEAIYKLPGLLNCNTAIDAALTAQNPGNGLAYACQSLNAFPVTVTISNLGLPSINNFDVSYKLDADTVVTQSITNPISFGNNNVFTFSTPIDISSPISHQLKTWLSLPTDANHNNDTLVSSFTTSPLFTAPISETFQGATFPPSNWLRISSNVSYQWAPSASITGSTGTSTIAAWFDNYSYNSPGMEDKLTTELIGISGMTQPTLSFYVAYAQYQAYEDELRVEISTDCGTSFIPTGYAKKGAVLASAGQSNTDWKPTTAANWRKDVIDLTPYLSSGSVLLRFVNVNDYGNNLYIDNVNVSDGPLSVANIANSGNIEVYPNPGNGLFNYRISNLKSSKIKVEVLNANGQLVYEKDLSNLNGNLDGNIDLQGKPKGIYLLKVNSDEKNYYQKLMLK